MTSPPPTLDLHTHIELLRALAATAAGATITCASGSMEPYIRVGDRVRIVARPPRAGDVALFESTRGNLILHRLIYRVPGTRWWMQTGDAAVGPPGFVHERRIIGVRQR